MDFSAPLSRDPDSQKREDCYTLSVLKLPQGRIELPPSSPPFSFPGVMGTPRFRRHLAFGATSSLGFDSLLYFGQRPPFLQRGPDFLLGNFVHLYYLWDGRGFPGHEPNATWSPNNGHIPHPRQGVTALIRPGMFPADEFFWGEEPYPTSDVDCPAVIFLIAHARLGYLLFTA